MQAATASISINQLLFQYPIESDDLALHLAVKHGVRVVMCASSALKILSNPWVGDSPTYVIPVVVKCHFSERTSKFVILLKLFYI